LNGISPRHRSPRIILFYPPFCEGKELSVETKNNNKAFRKTFVFYRFKFKMKFSLAIALLAATQSVVAFQQPRVAPVSSIRSVGLKAVAIDPTNMVPTTPQPKEPVEIDFSGVALSVSRSESIR
jgi:hypothetical protein